MTKPSIHPEQFPSEVYNLLLAWANQYRDCDDLAFKKEVMNEFFDKYHIESLGFPAVVHHFKGVEPEDSPAHDHPFRFNSWILKGSYVEKRYIINPDGSWHYYLIPHREGTSHNVEATDIHKIVILPDDECWTLMLPEKGERKSGFWRFDEKGAHFREWDQVEFEEI